MKFILKLGVFCLVVYFLLFCTGVVSDNIQLKNSLIRLHIVGNSDSKADQEVKLLVRDEILAFLEPQMQVFGSKAEAEQFIRENIEKITERANQALKTIGEDKIAKVSYLQEKFNIRNYETFSLPSGVYDALRIEIGEGAGQNWWCVAFPTLCMPATGEEFSTAAVSSGFSETLVKTIAEDETYKVRFFFMDWIGRMENFFN